MSGSQDRLGRLALPLILVFTTFSLGLAALWTGTGIGRVRIPAPAVAFLFLMIATPALSLALAIRGLVRELLLVLAIGGSGLVGLLVWAYLQLLRT